MQPMQPLWRQLTWWVLLFPGALLLALTTVPVASSYLLKGHGRHEEEAWFRRLRTRYGHALTSAMSHRGRTIGIAVAVVTVAIGSMPFLGTEFMPRLDEGSILIETRKLPSVALDDSVAISTRIEQIVKTFPEVKQVVTKIGRPDLATEAARAQVVDGAGAGIHADRVIAVAELGLPLERHQFVVVPDALEIRHAPRCLRRVGALTDGGLTGLAGDAGQRRRNHASCCQRAQQRYP